ncbi:MAG TPA: hypothetical protein VM716_01060 [Gemmatimonadales bacterium]|nr:hypothetical protein [Gemmatimonadales bacterium]
MTFKASIWYPIAVALTGINLAGVWFAVSEPVHSTTHAVLAVAFGLWAYRLRQRIGGSGVSDGSDVQAKLDALDAEVGQLRQELAEAHERLDFAERLLAQKSEQRAR